MKKYLFAILTLIVAAAIIAGCSAAETETETESAMAAEKDLVLEESPGSFTGLVADFPAIVSNNTAEDHYYRLSVDGETALLISHDYALTGREDILIETPLQPFVDAGLDISKLTGDYKIKDGKFYVVADYGSGTGTKDSVTDSLFESVAYDRPMLIYHRAYDYCETGTKDTASNQPVPDDLDRYGIRLPQGKFEYAKDYTESDRDIVFLIEAKPLAAIGVDIRNVDGWKFETLEDIDCNDIDMLLKTYDLNK